MKPLKPDLILNPNGSVAWAKDRRTRREYERQRAERKHTRAQLVDLVVQVAANNCLACPYYVTCTHFIIYHPNQADDSRYDRDVRF